MNPATWIRTAASGAWELAFVDAAVKATLLLLVAVLATWLLRRASAALRHRIWCLTFGALVLLPILSWALPAWRIAILPPIPARSATAPAGADPAADAASRHAAVAEPGSADSQLAAVMEPHEAWPPMPDADDATSPIGSRGVSAGEIPAGGLPATEGVSMPGWRSWRGALAVWLSGVLLSAVPFGLSVARNVSLRLNARRVTDRAWIRLRDELSQRLGLRRPVELLETDLPLVPMTWGIVWSIVLLPLEARAWNDCLKRTVLLHELAHVKRCDVGFQILARVACAIYWFHPLAWYALRRLRIERELACDDCVLSAGERPSEYAGQLLEIARRFRPIGLGAAVAMAQTSNLEGRVRALFDRARSRMPLGARSARLLLACAALVVATLAMIKPATRAADPNEPDSSIPSSDAPAVDENLSKRQRVSGRVVGPDGNPVPKARVLVIRSYTESGTWNRTSETVSTVQCDAAGNFAADVSDQRDRFASLDNFLDFSTLLVAVADGFGPDWYAVQRENKEVILRLVRDTVPIEGRVLDLEGRPVPGVKVSIRAISTASSDLEQWIARARDNPTSVDPAQWDFYAAATKVARFPIGKRLDLWGDEVLSQSATDATGRFTLKGLGADRLVQLEMEGRGIAKTWVHVVTRRFEAVPLADGDPRFQMQTCFGARFVMTAEPSQPIQGVVRDADTGDPLAGVEVRLDQYADSLLDVRGFLSAVTDTQGRYVLDGVPKPNDPKRKTRLRVVPGADLPYFRTDVEVAKGDGLDPVVCDVELTRAIWVRGRAIDQKTGEPVPGMVSYFPFLDNSAATQFANFNAGIHSLGFNDLYATEANGAFRIPALPGRGLLAFIAKDAARYPIGEGAGRIKGLENADSTRGPLNVYHLIGTGLATALREINPPQDAQMFSCQIQVPPLDEKPLLFVDPDGQPLAGVTARGLWPKRTFGVPTTTDDPRPTASAELVGIGESKHRMLWLTHESRKLGAMVEITADDFQDGQPLQIVLKPCATLSGRLVDSAGKPIQGAWGSAQPIPVRDIENEPAHRGAMRTFHAAPPRWEHSIASHRTDENGRFQIDRLPPGIGYELTIGTFDRETLKKKLPPLDPGALVDMGDLEALSSSTQRSEAAAVPAGAESEADPQSKESPDEDPAAPGRPARERAAKQASSPAVDADTIHIRGQVVGPDGGPVSGIAVYRPVCKVPQPRSPDDIALERCAVSAPDGRFALTMSLSDWPQQASQMPLIAYHEAHGLAWGQISRQPDSQEVTLKLIEDQPVRGRILDTQGRPIAGAKVQVNGILAPTSENLEGFLTAWKQEWRRASHVTTMALHVPMASILGATTNEAGQFELQGIGKERVALLHVGGPFIAQTVVFAVTRPGFDANPYNEAAIAQTPPALRRTGRTPRLVGPGFDYVAEPELVIEGRVHVGEERTAVSGAWVFALTGYDSLATARADATGEFELRGLPRNGEPLVRITPPDDSDLLGRLIAVGVPTGESTVPLDVELRRGVVVTGQVLDRQTGNGLRAGVRFAPLPDNPYFGQPGYDAYQHDRTMVDTDREGRFRLVIIPGPGVLMAQVTGSEIAIGDQTVKPYRLAEFSDEDRQRVPVAGTGRDRYFTAADNSSEFLGTENAVKWLGAEPGEGPIECNLHVERGETVEVRVYDEQGAPLSDAYVAGLTESWPITYRLPEPTCTVYALSPQRPRTIIFYHPDRLLASTVVVSGDEPEPLDVRLAPVHSLTGRAVDASGAPVAEAEVNLGFIDDTASELYRLLKLERETILTDAAGRFRLEGIVGGLDFRLSFRRGQNWLVSGEKWEMGRLALKAAAAPGQPVDLGDITVNPR